MIIKDCKSNAIQLFVPVVENVTNNVEEDIMYFKSVKPILLRYLLI